MLEHLTLKAFTINRKMIIAYLSRNVIMSHLSRQFFRFSKLGLLSFDIYNFNIPASGLGMSRASVSEFILTLDIPSDKYPFVYGLS